MLVGAKSENVSESFRAAETNYSALYSRRKSRPREWRAEPQETRSKRRIKRKKREEGREDRKEKTKTEKEGHISWSQEESLVERCLMDS